MVKGYNAMASSFLKFLLITAVPAATSDCV